MRSRPTLGLVILLISAPSHGQGSAEAAAPACFPTCRDGFMCHEGRCISRCNPPCPAGLESIGGRRCEPPLPSQPARPYEPPLPPSKDFAELSHALLGFHWGLPGSLGTDDRDGDSAHTLGFNLRADAPLAKYVLLGPLVQFGSWRPQAARSHDYYIDLDLLLRLRAPITTSRFNYQLWIGAPIGVSLNVLGADAVSGAAKLGVGWNVGVLFGGAVHFSRKLGVFAEAGWQQHRLTHDRKTGPDLDFELQQPIVNLGLIVRN